MEEKNLSSNKMKEQPIGRLLLNMSLPAILSMLVQALYNVVDSIFVSNYNTDGMTALSIIFPLQLIMSAFGIGIGVGANVCIAKKLGEGKREAASDAAREGLIMTFIAAMVFIVLGFTIVKPFIRLFNDRPEVIEQGESYMVIVMGLGVAGLIEITSGKLLQATGNMKAPMISQLIGACTNIILDPIFIFDSCFGVKCFGLGIRGAAIATVIGQFAACTFVLAVLLCGKHDISISPRGFRFKWCIVGEILQVGLPSVVMTSINSFAIMIMNGIVGKHEHAIDGLGIYFKMQSFVLMPVFGLMQGATPILSYNYGYGDRRRYCEAHKRTLVTAFIMMAVGVALFEGLAEVIVRLFGYQDDKFDVAVNALRIICVCFIPASIGIVTTTCYQSLGKGLTSLVMCILRQIGFLIPIAFVLESIVGLNGAWLSYPIAESLVACIFLPLSLKSVRKVFDKIDSQTIEKVA